LDTSAQNLLYFQLSAWAQAVFTLTCDGDASFQRVASSIPEWLLGAVKRSRKSPGKQCLKKGNPHRAFLPVRQIGVAASLQPAKRMVVPDIGVGVQLSAAVNNHN
jgi:hypothetical protein